MGVAIALQTPSALLALDATWTGASSAEYFDAANWGPPGNTFPLPPGTAIFATDGNGNTTIVNLTTAINQITFTSPGTAAYTLGADVGADTISLDNSNSGGKVNVTLDVASNQLINANLTLGLTAGSSSGYQFNNASAAGAILTVAGDIAGGSGGTAGAKVLTLLGGGAGVVSGSITNGGASSLTVTISGGTWTLSGPASAFTGPTFAQNGITYTRGTKIDQAATLIIGSNGGIGNGVLNITNNAAVVQAGGGDRALSQSIVLGDNGFTVSGTNSLSTSGKLVLGGSATITNNIAGAGKTFAIGDNIEIRNAASGSRTITFAGSGTTVLDGPLVNYNPALTSTSVGSLSYAGTGTLKSTGTNTYTGVTTVSAGGTYLVNGTHTVAAVGAYTINGTLGGTGTISPSGANSVNVNAAGILSPGDSTLVPAAQTGVFNVGSTINLNGGSSVAIQLGGSSPGSGQGFYDQLNMANAAGAVNLSGIVSLSLSLVNGYAPSSSAVFYILTRADFGAFFVLFDGTSEGGVVSLGGGYEGQITYLADWTGTQAGSSLTGGNDVAIYNVAAVPEPVPLALAALGIVIGLFTQSRRLRPQNPRIDHEITHP